MTINPRRPGRRSWIIRRLRHACHRRCLILGVGDRLSRSASKAAVRTVLRGVLPTCCAAPLPDDHRQSGDHHRDVVAAAVQSEGIPAAAIAGAINRRSTWISS